MEKCPKCKVELELVKADEPWHPDYYICPECDGTFNLEELSDER